VVKVRAGHFDPAVLAAGQMSFGLLPLLAAGAVFEANPFTLRWTPTALASLFYLALLGSATAFLLYYWLVQKIAVTKTLLISLVIPVVALLIGALTIGEHITWRIAAGSAAILSGIGLIIFKPAIGTATTLRSLLPRRSPD
jgi:drug/metabolite transporter (DMT)-like permease